MCVGDRFFALLREAALLVGVNLGTAVRWEKIQHVVLKTNNIRWSDQIEKVFNYIDLSSVERNNNSIIATQTIDRTNAPSRAQQIVCKNDIIFGTTRPMLRRVCLIPGKFDGQICSTGFCVLRADESKLTPKWLYYCISTTEFYNHIATYEKGASYPAITDREVKKYKIPIPSLAVQQHVVGILDCFDTLVNSIAEGLPKEIEQRQKQYEYYRERLLDFPK